jgi:hypothetical protein
MPCPWPAQRPELRRSDPFQGPPLASDQAAALLDVVRTALADVDVIQLEEIPALVAGRANPLLLTQGAAPSRVVGNRLTVATKVKDFMASRCKKYRKEAERSRPARETLGERIDWAYRMLEAWQAERHCEAGHDYWLNRPESPSSTAKCRSPAATKAQLVASLLGIT